MKKAFWALFGIVFLMVSTTAYSQDISQGTMELSGGFDLAFSSLETEVMGEGIIDQDAVALPLTGFYYVMTNVGIGLAMDYEYDETMSSGERFESTLYALGPAISYNVRLDTGLSLKLQGAVGYVHVKEQNLDGIDVTYEGSAWQIGGTLCYFIGHSFSIDCYLRMLSISADAHSLESDYVVEGVQTGVGGSIYF